MKKMFVIFAAVFMALFQGCGSVTQEDYDKLAAEKEEISKELETVKAEYEKLSLEKKKEIQKSSKKDEFIKTPVDLENLPESDGLEDIVKNAIEIAGIKDVTEITYGNFIQDDAQTVLDAYIITNDETEFLASLDYSVPQVSKWKVNLIKGVESGRVYYMDESLVGNYKLYDYQTGEVVSDLAKGNNGSSGSGNVDEKSSNSTEEEKNNTQQEPVVEETETQEEVSHREGMYGVSDKNIRDLDSSFSVSDVRNDVTGKWRISSVAETFNIEEYALSYYNKCFTNDDQIHGIVNFNLRTTTCISVMGDTMLDVSIHEYVKGEEHDAALLFSGMLLKEYFIYLDNGDIEEVQ